MIPYILFILDDKYFYNYDKKKLSNKQVFEKSKCYLDKMFHKNDINTYVFIPIFIQIYFYLLNLCFCYLILTL